MRWYSKRDSLYDVVRDARDPNNPQGGIPHSIQQDAQAELRRRGFSRDQVEAIRLGNYTPPHAYRKTHGTQR